MNFEDISSIGDLESVSGEVIWQNFEKLSAFIFEKNDFQVSINRVLTCDKNRRQYDVISRRGDRTYLVECKQWRGRCRLHALKKAIEQHKERVSFYKDITGEEAIPVVVTLVEEEIRLYDGVPVVPILKLDAFIRESEYQENETLFESYGEELHSPDEMSSDSIPDFACCEGDGGGYLGNTHGNSGPMRSGERRMPYYSEAESGELRMKVEGIVMKWPGVSKKAMFGSPAYIVGKTYFAMLVTGGIILTRLTEPEKEKLLKEPGAGYFEGHGRVMKKWIHVPVSSPSEVDSLVPYLRSSYENARDETV